MRSVSVTWSTLVVGVVLEAMKLAANLSFLFKDQPLLQRFKAASLAGFKAVELGADILDALSKEQLVAAKEEANVEVIGLCAQNGSQPGDMGLAAQFQREEEFQAVLARAIECATALQCSKIHALAGTVDPSAPESVKRAEETYIANLKYAADECAKNGIMLLIEPISTIQNYFLRHQQQAVEIIKKVGKNNVKIEFDTYHAQTLDGNMTVFLRNNFEYIGHVQISQVPGRHEPNENGEINFPFFFKSLASLGYDGWLGCEYIPTGTTEEGLEWAKPYLDYPERNEKV